MRLNESTILVGKNIFLVPYRREHVEKYHEWLSDPKIREATASEPLTLEEEYDMQRSWHLDDDKLTFIILRRSQVLGASSSEGSLPSLTDDMIGDVNLFLTDAEDDETNTQPVVAKQGELEIMIAEESARRQGLASQALQLMIAYASRPPLSLPPSHFLVRIGMENKASIAMFEKLGFQIVKEVEIFKEVEMRVVDSKAQQSLSIKASQDLSTMSC